MKINSMNGQNFCGYSSVSSSFVTKPEKYEVYVLTTKLDNKGQRDLDEFFKIFPDLYKTDDMLTMKLVKTSKPYLKNYSAVLQINDKPLFHELENVFDFDMPKKVVYKLNSCCAQLLERIINKIDEESCFIKTFDSPKSFAQTLKYLVGHRSTMESTSDVSRYIFDIYKKLGTDVDRQSAKALLDYIDKSMRQILK